jgi:hypothetical protein
MLRAGILSLVRRHVKQCGGEFGTCRCRGGCWAAQITGWGAGLLHGHRPSTAAPPEPEGGYTPAASATLPTDAPWGLPGARSCIRDMWRQSAAAL